MNSAGTRATIVSGYFSELFAATWRGWNRFWFTPSDPATYCLIRVLGGWMIFYTHLVWTLDLEAFFGPTPWIAVDAIWPQGQMSGFSWSYLYYIQSTGVLWTVHLAALVVLAMFAMGLFTRVTSVLAFIITVSYANRVPHALFGLDQVNAMLAMYLMIGPCGARYSLDRLIAKRRGRVDVSPLKPSVAANVGIRLMQLHLCVIYLFSGLGKLQGVSWWDGTAMWLTVANLEYQSVDMTWMAHWPLLLNFFTHLTIVWEVSYCVLAWPRLTRPIVVCLAIPLHLGIAAFLGMITFGTVMVIANLCFVSPVLLRTVLERKPISASQAG